MAILDDQNSSQIADALAWAAGYVDFHSSERVTDHPWAKTYALRGVSSTTYLKIVPEAGAGSRKALAQIASIFSNDVPQLISSHLDQGFFLYKDFKGRVLKENLGSSLRKDILSAYGAIQSQGVVELELLDDMQHIRCSDLFVKLQHFLRVSSDGQAPSIDGSLTADYFVGEVAAAEYHSILASVSGEFQRFLSRGDALTVTVNHCDLRTKNIARRMDGSLVIYDWDDAVAAPPGLSLHALFSGSERPIAAIWGENSRSSSDNVDRDRKVIDHYIEALCADGNFPPHQLREALASTACAGVIYYLLGFANYPVSDRSLRRTIGKNLSRRFSDLLNVAHLLLVKEGSGDEKRNFSKALRRTGRTKRADRFDRAVGLDSQSVRITSQPPKFDVSTSSSEGKDCWLQTKLVQSDEEGVVPSITISSGEQKLQRLSSNNRRLGVEIFKRHGTLLMENAIPVDLVKQCHAEFMADNERYFHATRHDDALRVGDKRFMITLEFKGGFADPRMFASPMVTPIMFELLSSDFILGSLTAVASLPGSADQRLHKDNQALFKEVPDGSLPSFSIAMIVPLIPLNEETGATRVVKGSHRHSSSESKKMPYQDPTVELGSCFFMDSRLTHMGRANNSQQVRPITSIVYQRPWYQDNLNYKKQKPIKIDAQQLESVPSELRRLVEWAV